ncbi:uncharacterized protein LOC133727455 [Rosa rugosa]|uniref:uncharacterized protein LOC133727455 n=1 Tax=Rosa rugosa TaxID=74645 RepID=UPI002B40662B|nr:uncharacterized protein LOC133727455 [Rosa rugosa]
MQTTSIFTTPTSQTSTQSRSQKTSKSTTMEAAYTSSSSITSKQAPLPYHHSSLHSVKKNSAKPWRKPAVAPLPPTPPRVYKVDPINFRDLVQKLTSAPEYLNEPTRSTNLQSVAPPPIEIQRGPPHVPSPVSAKVTGSTSPFSVMYKDLAETLGLSSTPHHQKKAVDQNITGDSSYLRLNLSPASQHWFSFPMLSPGTLTSLEL